MVTTVIPHQHVIEIWRRSRWISARGRRALLEKPNASLGVWQPDSEGESPITLAFDDDFSTVCAHDSANDQKPESRSTRLGCEIRLENATDIFRRDSAACIGEGNELVGFICPRT